MMTCTSPLKTYQQKISIHQLKFNGKHFSFNTFLRTNFPDYYQVWLSDIIPVCKIQPFLLKLMDHKFFSFCGKFWKLNA